MKSIVKLLFVLVITFFLTGCPYMIMYADSKNKDPDCSKKCTKEYAGCSSSVDNSRFEKCRENYEKCIKTCDGE